MQRDDPHSGLESDYSSFFFLSEMGLEQSMDYLSESCTIPNELSGIILEGLWGTEKPLFLPL